MDVFQCTLIIEIPYTALGSGRFFVIEPELLHKGEIKCLKTSDAPSRKFTDSAIN